MISSHEYKHLLRSSNPPIALILSNSCFFEFLRSRCEDMMYFLANNFRSIYRLVFCSNKATNGVVRSFLMIFKVISFDEMKSVYEESNFFNFLLEFIENVDDYDIHKQLIYLDVLESMLIDENLEIRDVFKGNDILTKLINEIGKEWFYDFIENFIISYKDKIHLVFNVSHLVEYVCGKIVGNSLTNLNAQRLLRTLINYNFEIEVAENLVKGNVIGELLWYAIKQRDINSFNLIKYLNIISSMKKQNSNLKTIHITILSRKKEFCKTILEHNTYDEVSNTSLNLLNNWILEEKTVDNDIIQVVSKLSKDFFKFPTNSFLHNGLLSLFQLLYDNGLLNDILVKDFSETLAGKLSAIKNNEISIYRSQITLILPIITPFIQSNNKEIKEMKNYYKQREQIVKILKPSNALEKKENKKKKALKLILPVLIVLILLLLIIIRFFQRK